MLMLILNMFSVPASGKVNDRIVDLKSFIYTCELAECKPYTELMSQQLDSIAKSQGMILFNYTYLSLENEIINSWAIYRACDIDTDEYGGIMACPTDTATACLMQPFCVSVYSKSSFDDLRLQVIARCHGVKEHDKELNTDYYTDDAFRYYLYANSEYTLIIKHVKNQ